MPKIILNSENIGIINRGRPDRPIDGAAQGCHVVTDGKTLVVYVRGEHILSIVNCENRILFDDRRPATK